MNTIITLLALAFALYFFELFVPGGILALIGSLLMIGAAGVAYIEYGFTWAIIILFFCPVAALGLFFLEIKVLTHTRIGRQLTLKSSITHRLNAKADDKLVGQHGVTLTAMAPTGKVLINGSTFTARSEDSFLSRGVEVRVSRTETFKLIVAKK